MNEYIQAVLLGFIQGITEFLPISSSGHLALAHQLFDFQSMESDVAFDIFLHLGTLFAVAIYFFGDIKSLIPSFFTMCKKFLSGKTKRNDYTVNERFVFYIIIATLPLVFIALAGLNDYIEAINSRPEIIGIILMLNGIILISGDRLSCGKTGADGCKIKNALCVGVCQGLSVVPGLSRSGSTITGGLLSGFSRSFAVKFSFILSFPAIFGANVLHADELIHSDISLGACLLGALSAAVFGLFAIKLLDRMVKKSRFSYFGYYCILLGLISLILSLK